MFLISLIVSFLLIALPVVYLLLQKNTIPLQEVTGPPRNLSPAQLYASTTTSKKSTPTVTSTLFDLEIRGYITITKAPYRQTYLAKTGKDISDLTFWEQDIITTLFGPSSAVYIGGKRNPDLKQTADRVFTHLKKEAETNNLRLPHNARPAKIWKFLGYLGLVAFFVAPVALAMITTSKLSALIIAVGMAIFASLCFVASKKALPVQNETTKLFAGEVKSFKLRLSSASGIQDNDFLMYLPYAAVFDYLSTWSDNGVCTPDFDVGAIDTLCDSFDSMSDSTSDSCASDFGGGSDSSGGDSGCGGDGGGGGGD